MDNCQPISVELQNGEKAFILLVEDQDHMDQGDQEHFYCASSHYTVQPAVLYPTADDAMNEAFARLKPISPIVRVLPTMGHGNVLTLQQLEQKV